MAATPALVATTAATPALVATMVATPALVAITVATLALISITIATPALVVTMDAAAKMKDPRGKTGSTLSIMTDSGPGPVLILEISGSNICNLLNVLISASRK